MLSPTQPTSRALPNTSVIQAWRSQPVVIQAAGGAGFLGAGAPKGSAMSRQAKSHQDCRRSRLPWGRGPQGLSDEPPGEEPSRLPAEPAPLGQGPQGLSDEPPGEEPSRLPAEPASLGQGPPRAQR